MTPTTCHTTVSLDGRRRSRSEPAPAVLAGPGLAPGAMRKSRISPAAPRDPRTSGHLVAPAVPACSSASGFASVSDRNTTPRSLSSARTAGDATPAALKGFELMSEILATAGDARVADHLIHPTGRFQTLGRRHGSPISLDTVRRSARGLVRRYHLHPDPRRDGRAIDPEPRQCSLGLDGVQSLPHQVCTNRLGMPRARP